MDIVYENDICIDEYNYLRKTVGWKEVEEIQGVTGLSNSAYIICAKCDHNVIGMARVISDGGYFFFVVDVMVNPEYQGFGIGMKLMESVMSFIDGKIQDGQTANISLMSMKGKEFFYEKLGFKSCPNSDFGCGMNQYLRKSC